MVVRLDPARTSFSALTRSELDAEQLNPEAQLMMALLGAHQNDLGRQVDTGQLLQFIQAFVQLQQRMELSPAVLAGQLPHQSGEPLGALSPTSTQTSGPGSAGARLFEAIVGQESGGDSQAVNKDSGATGIGQVMPENIGPWSKEILGREVSTAEFKANPKLQEQIVRGKLDQYYQEGLKATGSEREAVRYAGAKWYSGDGNKRNSTSPQNGYPSIASYADQVLQRYGKASGQDFGIAGGGPVEAQAKDLYQATQAGGLDLEARSNSRLAQALQTGDYSQLGVQDLIQLIGALLQYLQPSADPNGVAPASQDLLRPKGAWAPHEPSAAGPGSSSVNVAPLKQQGARTCGATSAAMAINALNPGKNMTEAEVMRKYNTPNGPNLLGAMSQESGRAWKDYGNLEPGNVSKFAELLDRKLNQEKSPIVIGLGGTFTASNGHIVTITGFDKASGTVTYNDPADGKVKTTTLAYMASQPPHRDGRFVYATS